MPVILYAAIISKEILICRYTVKPSPVRVPVGGPLGKPTTYTAYSLRWTAKLFSLVWIGIFSWLCAGHMTSSNGHGERPSLTSKREKTNLQIKSRADSVTPTD
eukprot:15326775-Ditylum_brightwellii.AAC.1